jgi:predicted permease
MRWMDKLRLRARSLLRKNRIERELTDELRFHLEQQIEENLASGMSLPEARYAARRSVGGIEQFKEECRDMRGVHWIENLLQDTRYAIRMLAKSPGFTAVAVLSLALGIGANTAIFSVVNAILLRLLPVDQPRQLVELHVSWPGQTEPPAGGFSYPLFERFRERNQVLNGILTVSKTTLRATIGNDASAAEGRYVSDNFYPLLGVRPALGRTIANGDEGVVVINYGLWQRAYGGDPSVIGRKLMVEEKPLTIIGVTEQRFSGIQAGSPHDFSVPIAAEPQLRRNSWLRNHNYGWLTIVGRLNPGQSPREANAHLNVIYKQYLIERSEKIPDGHGRQQYRSQTIATTPASSGLSQLRDQYSKPLLILMAVTGAVLLIACVNLANLLLARSAARRGELGVRLALGASRSRLVRQLMTEALLLCALGAGVGLVFARWTSAFLLTFLPSVQLDVHPDTRVLGFTGVVSVMASLIFGLMPALRATQDVKVRSGGRLRSVFIVSQVALSLILVIGAALFIATLRNLETLDPGFRRDRVLLATVNPGKAGYKDAHLLIFYRQLLERLNQAPRVSAASLSMMTPIAGGSVTYSVTVEGYAARPDEENAAYLNRVSPRYFETMGTPVLLGRDFNVHDLGPESPPVALINETMARYYFRDANPIGRHVKLGQDPPAEIIGVVKDAKYVSLRETVPRTVYVSCLRSSENNGSLTLEVQTLGDPLAAAGVVRDAVGALDRNVPVSGFLAFSKRVGESLLQEQLMATLSGLFGGLALLMACIGLYGVLAYAVAQRTREIGIRFALGARPAAVVSLVLREMLLLVAIGVAIGIPATLALGRFIASLLYGLNPGDPWMLSAATGLLFAVAALAAYLPARRASRVDPMQALRYE